MGPLGTPSVLAIGSYANVVSTKTWLAALPDDDSISNGNAGWISSQIPVFPTDADQATGLDGGVSTRRLRTCISEPTSLTNSSRLLLSAVPPSFASRMSAGSTEMRMAKRPKAEAPVGHGELRRSCSGSVNIQGAFTQIVMHDGSGDHRTRREIDHFKTFAPASIGRPIATIDRAPRRRYLLAGLEIGGRTEGAVFRYKIGIAGQR